MTAPISDTEVPAFWQSLGLPGIADIHVHFLPPRMLARVWEYFDNLGRRSEELSDNLGRRSDEPSDNLGRRSDQPRDNLGRRSDQPRDNLAAGPTGDGPLVAPVWPIIYRWSDEDRVAHLESMGVRAFTALAYAHKPGMAANLNAWTLDFAARTPGCVPSATFFPEPGVNRYTRAAIDAGARVFKVHVQVGGFNPAHSRLDAVWGVLAEAGIPVVVHTGSGPMPGEYTGPEPFAAVLRRHPTLTAVVAHMGVPEYDEFLELAEKYERVALDTTMAFTRFLENVAPFPRVHLPRLRDLGLAGKVLLGSDFPNLPYPYAEQLAGLAALELGDDWLRAVCWDNVMSMLGLPVRP